MREMPTITELPNDASDSAGVTATDSDHQLQPMGHENRNPTNVPAQRDIGRVRDTPE